jgi:hypothetical protein
MERIKIEDDKETMARIPDCALIAQSIAATFNTRKMQLPSSHRKSKFIRGNLDH